MPERFGAYLETAIKNAGMSRRKFASTVGYASANIDQIVHGKRSPPLNRINSWGKVLGPAIDSFKFRELALLEHCPAEIRDLVEAQRTELIQLKAKLTS